MSHFHILAEHVAEVFARMGHFGWMKVPVCFVMGGFALLFGAHNGDILSALVILVAFDLITGIVAAYVAGEPITSRRALKTASKLGVYSVLCSSAFLVEGIVPAETIIDVSMISFLAITEFISIMENAGKMGFEVPQKLLRRAVEYRNNQ